MVTLRCAQAGVLLAAIFLVPSAGQAAPSCTVSASVLSFGAMTIRNLADVDSTGTVEISCNNPNVSYTLLLSAGAGTYAQRRMVANGNSLAYNIFTSSTYTSVWGDGTGGSVVLTATVSSNPNGQNNRGIHTLYGRIPIASIQQAYSGTYSDAIAVTLIY